VGKWNWINWHTLGAHSPVLNAAAPILDTQVDAQLLRQNELREVRTPRPLIPPEQDGVEILSNIVNGA